MDTPELKEIPKQETKIISKEESFIKEKIVREKRKEALLKHLTELRNLIGFIDTKLLSNRAERRSFWKDFTKDEKSRQAAILALINHFEVYVDEQEAKIVTENDSGVASAPVSGT